MTHLDKAFSAFDRISLLAQLRDKITIAHDVDRLRCGSCQHWMKRRECPREHNVGGMTQGPSSGAAVCGQFQIAASIISLKEQRYAEAIAFAERHSLPIVGRRS